MCVCVCVCVRVCVRVRACIHANVKDLSYVATLQVISDDYFNVAVVYSAYYCLWSSWRKQSLSNFARRPTFCDIATLLQYQSSVTELYNLLTGATCDVSPQKHFNHTKIWWKLTIQAWSYHMIFMTSQRHLDCYLGAIENSTFLDK